MTMILVHYHPSNRLLRSSYGYERNCVMSFRTFPVVSSDDFVSDKSFELNEIIEFLTEQLGPPLEIIEFKPCYNEAASKALWAIGYYLINNQKSLVNIELFDRPEVEMVAMECKLKYG
jgi:hypothetical protein